MWMYFHCFYLGIIVSTALCTIFSRLRRLNHWVWQPKLSESPTNKQTSQTDTSEEWNIFARRENILVLYRDAPQARKFWVLWYHKQDFKCKNSVFESFLECFRSGNTWKYLKIFGLRPGLWLNPPPPLLKMFKNTGGGGVKWTDRKFDRYISIIPGNVQKNWLFYSHARVMQYFYSKSVLTFQLDQGDMVRAQEHLLDLTPSAHRDRFIWSWKCIQISCKPKEIPLFQTCGFHRMCMHFQLQMDLSRCSDGVRRCSWALTMSPWSSWNVRTDLKWKYWITLAWE